MGFTAWKKTCLRSALTAPLATSGVPLASGSCTSRAEGLAGLPGLVVPAAAACLLEGAALDEQTTQVGDGRGDGRGGAGGEAVRPSGRETVVALSASPPRWRAPPEGGSTSDRAGQAETVQPCFLGPFEDEVLDDDVGGEGGVVWRSMRSSEVVTRYPPFEECLSRSRIPGLSFEDEDMGLTTVSAHADAFRCAWRADRGDLPEAVGAPEQSGNIERVPQGRGIKHRQVVCWTQVSPRALVA
jgi:hypothetical protein